MSADGLATHDLVVRFGGLVAVDGASLEAPVGRVTGLIGPNGAGKTTIFNACSGLVRPSAGRVTLFGRDVTRLGAAARARSGLGRTFQRMELWDSLSVRDNVALGAEGALAGGSPWRQLVTRSGERAAVAQAAAEALETCGLGHLGERQVGSLSTGERRLVELARVLAGPFRVLLLDEPSSGLDQAEADRFGVILRRVVAERGVGVLLVEHHVQLVMDVCDHVYVLDFGKLLFAGSPQEVAASPVVRSAYLGEVA